MYQRWSVHVMDFEGYGMVWYGMARRGKERHGVSCGREGKAQRQAYQRTRPTFEFDGGHEIRCAIRCERTLETSPHLVELKVTHLALCHLFAHATRRADVEAGITKRGALLLRL